MNQAPFFFRAELKGTIMATSSFMGGTRQPEHVRGKDTNALGPSDNSDSGSDAQGAYGTDELSSDSDAEGTGERASVGMGMEGTDADIMPDHLERVDGDDADDAMDDTEGDASDVDAMLADDADDAEDADA